MALFGGISFPVSGSMHPHCSLTMQDPEMLNHPLKQYTTQFIDVGQHQCRIYVQVYQLPTYSYQKSLHIVKYSIGLYLSLMLLFITNKDFIVSLSSHFALKNKRFKLLSSFLIFRRLLSLYLPQTPYFFKFSSIIS